MSAAVYAEPYKLPAGALALAVHGAFFALLYFGVSWQTQPPQGMVVDIWDSLPEMKIAPAKVAPPEAVQPEPPKSVEPPKLAEPVPPIAPPKADIELAVKKKPKAKPVEIRKPVELKNPPGGQKKITEAEKAQQAAQAEQDRARAAQAAKQAAEAAAAITNEVGKYMGLIRSKIRSHIVPLDVADNAQVEFEVALLPDGEVLGDPKLIKSSGNVAYDAAVERAILRAQPLPLPPGMAAKKEFLNPNKLQLKVSPKE